ncbi:hypothetical protein PoB_005843700 [Plakobranchus ocellatus]|uniref:Uncharacterized protein n=1 Tax=Plakobranchus ocellatus TaxID=259542 RepID=A0AAV4CJR1_9GAST|nr:hypothetical protein PoB_005843700 [Plakobranchus ocellatus]
MKMFLCAIFVALAPLVLCSQICYPPQSTTVGFLTISETHSYSINDYTNGKLYFSPGNDIFGEPWTLVDLNAQRTYHKEKDQDCVYKDIDPEVLELFHQCIPDDAVLYGNIDGHDMYLTNRPGSIKWLMAVTPIENTPYYWRFISRFEFHGQLTDVGFVYINNLGILEPSLLEKDLSVCVPA